MRLLLVAIVGLALAAPAAGSERHPTLGELEHEVMCPTCKTLLELSHAPIAERMRTFIRGRIAAGETKTEIERELVAQFGPGVLAEPPRRGLGLLAWVLPLAGLGGGIVILAVVVRAWRHQAVLAPEARRDPAADRPHERAHGPID
jgi:cytochrome c-type biogenesis protein CcmH